ncbi:heme-binding protein [Aeromonas veronii]
MFNFAGIRNRQATQALGEWSRQSGRMLSYWSDPRFTGFAGGLPLWLQGQVVAAVGISGLSEAQDHELASEIISVLGTYLNR